MADDSRLASYKRWLEGPRLSDLPITEQAHNWGYDAAMASASAGRERLAAIMSAATLTTTCSDGTVIPFCRVCGVVAGWEEFPTGHQRDCWFGVALAAQPGAPGAGGDRE